VDDLTEIIRNRRFPVASKEAADLGALSELLLDAIAADLKHKRIVFVPDGALWYVPFGALPAPGDPGQRPLLATHEVVSLPSASVLSVLRANAQQGRTPAKTIAVFADPEFGSQFKRLEHTGEEALAIMSMTNESDRLVLVGTRASRDAALSGVLSDYRIVHFATHGFIDTEHPDLSSVVLATVNDAGASIDGFLRLQDIFGLKLNADMVVLSACETGLGQSLRGEGLVGMTRGFMYAGTPRVVVSLWKVDDAATAALMKVFYEGILTKRLKPADALRQAQLAIAQQPLWSNPYYWAAFTLQGDWQ
jgi:CHAT domain-containing protein